MIKVSTLEKYRFTSYEEIRDLENPDDYCFGVEYSDGSGVKFLIRLDKDELNGLKTHEDYEPSDYDTYFAEFSDAEQMYFAVPVEDYQLADIVAYKSV